MADDLCLLMYRTSSGTISVIRLLFFHSVPAPTTKLYNSLVPGC
jgi:hypothetical protein